MRERTTFSDEEVERYLSIEWEVSVARAVELARFAKSLVDGLEKITKGLKASAEAGDVYMLSAGVTALVMLLKSCEDVLDRHDNIATGHYVELLGSRSGLARMGDVIEEFFYADSETTLPEPRFTEGGESLL